MNLVEGKKQYPRFLIIARVGDQSLHRQWLKPTKSKNFDLCLSYYGAYPNRYKKDCDIYFQSKGAKWPKIEEVVRKLGKRLLDYDAIWFPDDDISTDANTIHKMFRIFHEQKLKLAQPALTTDSFYLWPITVKHFDYNLRYTKFVETMVPLFSRDALMKCKNTFNKNITGWGLDFIWPKLLSYPKKKIAILDITPVKHTRPHGGGDLYKNIKSLYKVNVYKSNELSILTKYGVDNSWVVNNSSIRYYGGLLKKNRVGKLTQTLPNAKKAIPIKVRLFLKKLIRTKAVY